MGANVDSFLKALTATKEALKSIASIGNTAKSHHAESGAFIIGKHDTSITPLGSASDPYETALNCKLPQLNLGSDDAIRNSTHPSTPFVIETYEDFLRDLLKATPRPTEKLLIDACKLVFERTDKTDCKSFALQMVRCVSHVRDKKSATTGKKTADATYRLVQIMKEEDEEDVLEVVAVQSSQSLRSVASSGQEGPPDLDKVLELAKLHQRAQGKQVGSATGKMTKIKPVAKKTIHKKPAAQQLLAEVPKAEELGAAKLEEKKQREETILHFVRKVSAQKPGKSYVTVCYCDGSKQRQKRIVEFPESKYADHLQKALAAVKRIQEQKLTFNQARALKLALAE
ncbi:unnamed protein product [Symbiodinium microadriaticum]|nr:unnamed protein product [Symbiodinium microadriaticum]